MVINKKKATNKGTARNIPRIERRMAMNHEEQRLKETRDEKIPWKKWGRYLSERQWGTVREDYSESGDV